MRLFTCAYTPSFPDGVDESRKFTQNPHFEVFSSKVSENRSKISLLVIDPLCNKHKAGAV